MPTTTNQVYDGRGNLLATETINVSQESVNADDLRSKATLALVTNATFLALASPSQAQTLAQVQRLTRENNALIRLALGLLDDTAGT